VERYDHDLWTNEFAFLFRACGDWWSAWRSQNGAFPSKLLILIWRRERDSNSCAVLVLWNLSIWLGAPYAVRSASKERWYKIVYRLRSGKLPDRGDTIGR
jgi:hypothetical protein